MTLRSIFVFLCILSFTPAKASEVVDILDVRPAPIDHTVMTMSISRDNGPAQKPILILQKTNRLPQVSAQDDHLLERMAIKPMAEIHP